MPRRIQPLRHPVEIVHDGRALPAERGEPLVAALIAENRLPLARSPKLHRPRGPYCLRGGCDGCLARIDGVPNVMTCLRPARGGERIETQNVLGSREMDLLRASDFLFPHGIDHHRLFAGVAGVSSVVQAFARRAAGLGRLPEQALARRAAKKIAVPVLIVGGGAAGLSAAAALGARAWLIDDAITPGGALNALEPARARELVRAARAAGARVSAGSAVIGLYREREQDAVCALVVSEERASFARCANVILATGCHAASRAFENNDLPGVWSAQAALRLLRFGISVGERVIVTGRGAHADALAGAREGVRRIDGEGLVRAAGRSRVSGIVVRASGREQKLACDALVIDGPGAPTSELVGQVGGRLKFDAERGFVPTLHSDGQCAERVYCAGSVIGDERDSAADGQRVGALLAARLG